MGAGDHTQAEALRLAKAHLEKMGWRYDAAKIGATAREILDGLSPPPVDHRPAQCADALKEAGKPHPRSSCAACDIRKFGKGCGFAAEHPPARGGLAGRIE